MQRWQFECKGKVLDLIVDVSANNDYMRKARLAPRSGRAAEIKAKKGSKVFVDIFEFFVNFKQGFFCDVDSGREVP